MKPADLAATLAACGAYREEQRERRASHAEVMRSIRESNRTDRAIERGWKIDAPARAESLAMRRGASRGR